MSFAKQTDKNRLEETTTNAPTVRSWSYVEIEQEIEQHEAAIANSEASLAKWETRLAEAKKAGLKRSDKNTEKD
jgi:hypothetical protein